MLVLFLIHLRAFGGQNADDVQKPKRLPERELEPDVGEVHRPERGDDLCPEKIDRDSEKGHEEDSDRNTDENTERGSHRGSIRIIGH